MRGQSWQGDIVEGGTASGHTSVQLSGRRVGATSMAVRHARIPPCGILGGVGGRHRECWIVECNDRQREDRS